MPRCKAPDILRSEAYSEVRRSKPVPCATRERMRATPIEDPARLVAGRWLFFSNLLEETSSLAVRIGVNLLRLPLCSNGQGRNLGRPWETDGRPPPAREGDGS